MSHSPLPYALTAALALTLFGCSEPVEETAPPVVPTAEPAQGAPQPAAPKAAGEGTEQPLGAQPAGDAAAATETEPAAVEKQAAYTAPFPERVELFAAPRRKGTLANTNGEQGEAVELMGFSMLEEPLALLLLNGQVSTLAEGDSFRGVKVVSIQPPKVVLQQGRQRSQLSLEN